MPRTYTIDTTSQIGKRYGRWVVLSYSHRKHNKLKYWMCRCDCGTEKPVTCQTLMGGESLNCGCVRRDKTINRPGNHGMKRTRVFRIWMGVKRRTLCKTAKDYRWYGAKGVGICERWKTFIHFFEDMGHPPSRCHSIDRIDCAKGYEPGNCRWATPEVQHDNRHNSKWYEHAGEVHTTSEWVRRHVSADRVRRNFKQVNPPEGFSGERVAC